MGLHKCTGLYLLLCISTILTLCHQSSACHLGTQTECEKAPFVPGYNLAGEGFDVVSLRRKGAYLINVESHKYDNNTCTVCENRFQQGQMQKLPLAIVDWRPLSHCSKQLSSALYYSTYSLIKSSTSQINNNWGVGLSLDDFGKAILGGSHSDIANFARSQQIMDKMTFALHEISCTYYSYRVVNQPELSEEFKKHLLQLPTHYSEKTKPQYQRIIDTYGTHYIRHVYLGGRVRQVTAFRTCLATLMGFLEMDIKNCLNIELKIALGFLPANISYSNKCSNILKDNMNTGFYQGFLTQKFEVLGGESYIPSLAFPADRYASWMNSLRENPEIISYDIFPLHHLVADSELSASLKNAVSDYIKENMLPLEKNPSHKCNLTPNLDHNCCPLRAHRGTMRVVVQRANGLKADPFSKSDAYVKVWYNNKYEQTYIIMNNDNPVWYIPYNFGSIQFGHALIFEVWDKDVRYDDFLGRCSIYPERGDHSHSCRLNKGVFYYKYIAECDTHLSGHWCGHYSPKA
ncbi:perforin-1-like [Hemibagrus wyckioides]|uniref:perforin-1-like n=1 Tax=Hemibagrus wyckioides TaxID=337641 RepID=UPI00266B54F1|nr:perforin-1-like [Hemibagrus wyckioides]